MSTPEGRRGVSRRLNRISATAGGSSFEPQRQATPDEQADTRTTVLSATTLQGGTGMGTAGTPGSVGREPRRKGTDHGTRNNLFALGGAAVGTAVLGALAIGINNSLNSDSGTSDTTATRDVGDVGLPANTLPAGIEIATPTPEPTAIPTPEAPKTVVWSREQVDAAQQAAAKAGKVAVLNTWTEEGLAAQDAAAKAPFIILNKTGFKEGNVPIYKSSFEGIISTITSGDSTKNIYITVNGTDMMIIVDSSNNILVKKGDKVSYGSPLIELNGNQLAKSVGASKDGYVIIGNLSTLSLSTDDIIHDANGLEAILQK